MCEEGFGKEPRPCFRVGVPRSLMFWANEIETTYPDGAVSNEHCVLGKHG